MNTSGFGGFAAIALLFPAIGVAISLLVFYWVIRLAVRDGILAARKHGARW
ncbi:hypothetical protein [Cellulomonas sp. WB94]|uniref:hypothetical protein n=1 Tax=Cellulomonas sp. WB94 TaxID=2173174 RepID=UPI0013048A82|nr:hypothetical protein [Cellulomonas sp. WB94]